MVGLHCRNLPRCRADLVKSSERQKNRLTAGGRGGIVDKNSNGSVIMQNLFAIVNVLIIIAGIVLVLVEAGDQVVVRAEQGGH